MEQIILYIIIGLVVAEYALSRVLNYLNQKNWKPEVPDKLKAYYDGEKYRKSHAYEKVNDRLELWSSTISTAIMVAILVVGGFGWLDRFVQSVTDNLIWSTLLFFGVIGIAGMILGLPFSIYKTFYIEEKFGFNRTTVKTFILDKIKGLILGAIIGGALLAAFVWFYQLAGQSFWIYAWVAFTAFSLFMTMFYTTIFVPIFNKLKPLEEGELRNAIEAYAQKVDFPLTNIYVIDGSKRSTKANAFFSGIGAKKSIVLYDTLIEDHTTEELVAILAHEVGHYKLKHIYKGFVLSSLQMLITLYLLALFIDTPELSKALGAPENRFYLNLIAFGILYFPISMITGLLMNVFSRKNEYEADDYAKKTYSAEPLKEALIKLSVKHLSNLHPHPAYVFVYYSHPPLLKRIKAMETF